MVRPCVEVGGGMRGGGRELDHSRMMDSYTKNITAALGMTRIKCALNPP